jgi:hypothetical protein
MSKHLAQINIARLLHRKAIRALQGSSPISTG